MPNENSPKRKAKLKIALNIFIVVVIVAGALWAGSYWLQMPTATLWNGRVADESTSESVKNQGKNIVELYYTYAAGDSPILMENLQSLATEKMQEKIAKTIEGRKEIQGGFTQVAIVNEIAQANVRERAASLDFNLTVTRYRIGMEADEQTVTISLTLVNEEGNWLLSALSPNEILWP